MLITAHRGSFTPRVQVGGDASYLISAKKHYVLQCPSAELTDVQNLAAAAIAIYPGGVIVLSAALLFACRKTLLYGESSTPFSRSIAFLHASLSPQFFYFDLLEMAKKLLLVGFASLIAPGSLSQITLAVVGSLLFLVLHLQSYPYKAKLDNVLATAAHLMLCMFFIWCMLLQTDALSDEEDSGKMSEARSLRARVVIISRFAQA